METTFEGQSGSAAIFQHHLLHHTPKQTVPTRWNTLSHHRLKQNNTTCCRFTQKRCFHSALSWRLSGSSAKGPLSAFKRVSMAGGSRRSHLCCQHSWSRLQPEDPRKSGILHQRTHHVLASTSWRPERDKKAWNTLIVVVFLPSVLFCI